MSSSMVTNLTIEPLQPRFGAEIGGVDLRYSLTPDVRDEIWRALLDFKVLFFRNQPLDAKQQIAFARQFGEIETYPVHKKEGHPELQALDSKYTKAAIWHTDVTWQAVAPSAAVLCSQTVPEVGGDTMWANGEAAYDHLSEELKGAIDELYAVHDSAKVGLNYVQDAEGHETRVAMIRKVRQKTPLVSHPIVRTHPETGRKSLFLNPALVSCIIGMSYEKSKALLGELHAAYLRPENTLRFRWTPNAVAMWDERNTLHYGVDDYGDAPRAMNRVLIAGTEIPYR